jgi:hypothetical protein
MLELTLYISEDERANKDKGILQLFVPVAKIFPPKMRWLPRKPRQRRVIPTSSWIDYQENIPRWYKTQGCNNIVISWLYRTCWNNLATSLIISIDRFHLTSRRPYWCTKTMKWRSYWCTVRELALSYSNISYCFTTPLGPPITWVKTIYNILVIIKSDIR